MEFTGERYIPGVGGSIALEHEHRYRMCIDAVKGKKVLDIACGEGFGSSLLAQHAEFVFGVDIDPAAVEHASNTYAHANISFLSGCCSEIPLDSCSVDVVVSFETIEHHDEHEEMMQEIRRVLKPGGALIISSPDKRIYSEARNFKNEFHVKELYAEEFAALLEKNFKHVAMFGQRIVYGSAILRESGKGESQSYGIESTEPVPGLPNPIYLIAVASESQEWEEKVKGGLLEETVYRSEAIIERADQHNKIVGALREQLASVTAVGGGIPVTVGDVARLVEGLQDRVETAIATIGTLNARLDALNQNISLADQSASRKLDRPISGLKALAFHNDGRPRGWLRGLILKDRKSGVPRRATRRILVKKDGRVRPCFQKWYSLYDASPALRSNFDYAGFLREIVSSQALAEARTLRIITTPHTQIIARLISEALQGSRFEISSGIEMPESFDHDLYIVVAPQMFPVSPPANKTIMFQMEQIRASSWATEEYISRLQNSLAVIDYSADNIAALVERGVPLKQLYYVPIRPADFISGGAEVQRDIDVLFYGSIAAERRGEYINALSKKYNVRVESNVFGEEIQALLQRSKIVVNVHYYEDALLETTRLSEALSNGARVVSEESVDQADRAEFEGIVDFVPVGDIEAFLAKVGQVLASWDCPVRISQEIDYSGMRYHLARALSGIAAFSFEELLELCSGMRMPSGRAVLALPEQSERYSFAKRNRLPKAWLFHGLRDIDGWKGCAKSYKFLATRALSESFDKLMIYEDDAGFQAEVNDRLEKVERYLASIGSEWDVFSGLLSDLSEDAAVTKISSFDGEELLHVNSVIGMVFGIYNKSALEMLESFEFLGNDTQRHTIDRYLEALSPRCVTTLPPIASHSEHLVSTLWPVDNSATVGMISRSLERLDTKRLSVIHGS